MIKTYLKTYLYFFILVIILTIILSIINYIVSFNNSILKISIPPVSMFISSIFLGKATKQKAYLEGIKLSIIYLLFTSIFKIIINSPFTYKNIIIFILIIISSILGAMLGINLKKES